MRRTLLASACSFGIAVSATAQDLDWPTYMHDNSRAGRTLSRLQTPLSKSWVIESSSRPELAWPGPGGKTIEKLKLRHRMVFDAVFHPVIVGDYMYYGSSIDHRIRCVELQSGIEHWSFTTGGPVRLAPTISNGRLYAGSDDGFAYCLDAADGHLVWKLRAGPRDERILARGRMTSRWPLRTSMLIDAGVVYFGAGTFPHETVYLHAADAATGTSIWCNDTISQNDAGRSDLTPQGYLLASEDYLFVPSGRTLPAAIDKTTGALVHKQHRGGKQVGGSQALLADNKILSVGEHHILALDQAQGDIIAKLRGRQMTLAGDIAYVAAEKEIIAVDRRRYMSANTPKTELAKQSAALRKKLAAHAFLASNREYQAALSSSDRTAPRLRELRTKIDVHRADYYAQKSELEALVGILWRTPSEHTSALILAGDTLVVGGVDRVIALAASSGQRLWSATVDGDARGLATAHGYLLVSTTHGSIYGFADAAHTTVAFSRPQATTPTNPYPADALSERYAAAATSILEHTGITQGFCLIVDGGNGRLAYELATRSELMITCAVPGAAEVKAARRALMPTGLYGTRITVDHQDLSTLPYPSYFANLIVSDRMVRDGHLPVAPEQIAHCLKPLGGVICFGPVTVTEQRTDAVAWLSETGLDENEASHENLEQWQLLRRGALPGAAGWTHQYGNAGATASIDDHRIKNGLRVLWYGDPGASVMVNRHQGAAAPISANGRLFVQGDKTLGAYDAYNGLKLWEIDNPGALRTGVFRNHEPGNLAADQENLYVVIGENCLRLDAATGELRDTYSIPTTGGKKAWGYLAVYNGQVFGTTTARQLIPEEERRRGMPSKSPATDQIFAFDVKSGRRLWVYQGRSIFHTAVAVADGRVLFIDAALTVEQRAILLGQDKKKIAVLSGAARELAEARLKRMDARLAVALDARSGTQLWAKPVDVTDCTEVGIGAGRLTLIAKNDHVVLCGANANGHYWSQFLKGAFERRRLVVLDAASGDKKWAQDANYRHRPIIIEGQIIAEPWAYELETGAQRMRVHPLTGMRTPWMFGRPGHHCGMVTATPNMMLFRSGFTAYYDLDSDSGTRHFAGHRPGCWINAIPANGLVLVPEASAGCACLFSLTSTIVFEPRPDRQTWGIYGAAGPSTPVRHMALNLGAPGDRRDRHGKLWLGYPRPASRRGIDLGLKFGERFVTGGKFRAQNSESFTVDGTPADVPWVFASSADGLLICTLPLIDGSEAETYTVRLSFAAGPNDKLGQRVFDVRLQNNTVLERFDVHAAAGGANRTLVREFHNIAVESSLKIELVPRAQKPGPDQLGRLCAIEVLRTGAKEIVEGG